MTWHGTVSVREAGAIVTGWEDHKELYLSGPSLLTWMVCLRKIKLLKPWSPFLTINILQFSQKILLQIQICFENILWKHCYYIFKTSVSFSLLLSVIRSFHPGISQLYHPVCFWLASVLGKLSIKHQWNLGSQCSPVTLDVCVRENQPKTKLNNIIPSWWPEGFIHTLNSMKWGNCRMQVSYTSSQGLNLQLWHNYSNLFVTHD